MPTLHRAFRNLFDRMTNGMSPQDQVRFIMNSPQLDRPISLPFLPRDSLTPERFLAAVEKVVQSNDQFTLDDSLNVNVIHVDIYEKHIYLYHHNNHYDIITSMPAFLAQKQYCHKCKKGYDKITDHPCGDLCMLCHRQSCPSWNGNIVTTVIDIIKVRNATTTINVTTAPPSLYVGPLSSARDVIGS
jgi:hypothetical protein